MYLFGALCIWSGISTLGNTGVSESLFYLGLNLLIILIGTLFKARVLALFGGIGLAMVAGDLSWYAFRLSFTFVLILSLVVALMLALALWWRNNESKLRQHFKLQLPMARQNKLEQN